MEQYNNINRIAPQIVELLRAGHHIILTHGNGPHVGSLLIQQDAAKGQVPEQPLDVLGAMTQGQIGYMLQQAMQNELRRSGIAMPVVTIITQAQVDPSDAAFSNPTKPVGPFYSQKEAQKLTSLKRWPIVHVAPNLARGYRRVVPSPVPIRISEGPAIRMLFDAGMLVIAAGGGGIPVVGGLEGLRGIEAVIDKDLASELLAEEVDATVLMLMTDVEKIKLHYGTPQETEVVRMDCERARQYMDEGHFPEGTMGPKVSAAIQFVSKGGRRAIISSIGRIVDAFDGITGTLIVK